LGQAGVTASVYVTPVPAFAGINSSRGPDSAEIAWIPAFAGMTLTQTATI